MIATADNSVPVPAGIMDKIPRHTKYPWRTMAPKESFLVTKIGTDEPITDPEKIKASMASQAINWGHRLTKRTKKKHLFRCAIEGAGVRVWRVI